METLPTPLRMVMRLASRGVPRLPKYPLMKAVVVNVSMGRGRRVREMGIWEELGDVPLVPLAGISAWAAVSVASWESWMRILLGMLCGRLDGSCVA